MLKKLRVHLRSLVCRRLVREAARKTKHHLSQREERQHYPCCSYTSREQYLGHSHKVHSSLYPLSTPSQLLPQSPSREHQHRRSQCLPFNTNTTPSATFKRTPTPPQLLPFKRTPTHGNTNTTLAAPSTPRQHQHHHVRHSYSPPSRDHQHLSHSYSPT